MAMSQCPCGTSVSDIPNAQREHTTSSFHRAYITGSMPPNLFQKVGFAKLFRKSPKAGFTTGSERNTSRMFPNTSGSEPGLLILNI